MNAKKITAMAMLTAVALVIFILEAQLPPPVAVPGIKMGLANIITLVTLVWYGRREAFTVLMLRIIIGSVFTGHLTSFMYSAAGGIMCFLVMAAAYRFLKEDKIWVVSILGAIAHNAAQLTVAAAATSTPAIFVYAPFLLISAIITGAFTGLAAMLVLKRGFFSLRRD